MKVRGPTERIVPKYTEWIEIPERFRAFVWDALEGKTPLEDIILKVLLYGKFEDIRDAFALYPDAVIHVALSYPEIHRGIRFWIKKWRDERDKRNCHKA